MDVHVVPNSIFYLLNLMDYKRIKSKSICFFPLVNVREFKKLKFFFPLGSLKKLIIIVYFGVCIYIVLGPVWISCFKMCILKTSVFKTCVLKTPF